MGNVRTTVDIVWLKRDLRATDHAPLATALEGGQNIIVLYCFEPKLLAAPQHSPRHWRFVYESLQDLQKRGWPVCIYWGEVTDALDRIAETYTVSRLLSHQETGHQLSFDRDRRVRHWCQRNGIPWQEYVQDAVIRGRKHREGFKRHVDEFLDAPLTYGPIARNGTIKAEQQPLFIEPEQSGLPLPQLPTWLTTRDPALQPGGETRAWAYLKGFTTDRGRGYARRLGNPEASRRSCSRISPYLAWGCVSAKQVYQWSRSAIVSPEFAEDLERFRERLWWRAHYFQKLEAEWQLEFRPINPVLAGLDRGFDQRQFDALAAGLTGLPMIDASMRCLRATGWLNFRMRAMLVTFTSFALWMDWRPVAELLARLFLDYDPGIHYAQLQMQAGLTGYHVPRHFNPYLQGEQFDPEGVFVHKWVPELRNVPAPWCHYPHRMTDLEYQLYGLTKESYPHPMVDYATAVAHYQDRYWTLRTSPEALEKLPTIWRKHCLPEDAKKYRRQAQLTRPTCGEP